MFWGFLKMNRTIAVGIGGAIGTLARYTIHQIPLPISFSYRPLLTMLINISGSFLLGFALSYFAGHAETISGHIRLCITTGVLGGYTTFSTLCKESIELLLSNQILYAAFYTAFTVLLGLCASWLGMLLHKRMERRRAA
jgi:CrcB protein